MNDALECPICSWRYVIPEIREAPASLGDIFGMGVDSLTSMWAHQENVKTERALHDHLAKHTPEEWLPALVRARQERDEAHRVIDFLASKEDAS